MLGKKRPRENGSHPRKGKALLLKRRKDHDMRATQNKVAEAEAVEAAKAEEKPKAKKKTSKKKSSTKKKEE
jgi:hypothetical protein